MKSSKRLISLFLAFLIMTGSIPLTAIPTFAEGDFAYSVLDGEVTITGYNGTDKNILIPDRIDGYSVTTIGEFAFQNNEIIESVYCPESITSIDSSAFYGCTALADIVVPDHALQIGFNAFYGTAYANEETNRVDGVLYIGNHLLEADNQAIPSSYTVKPGTITISDQAFIGLDRLRKLFVPESVCRIGQAAFAHCTNLAELHFENGPAEIGENAFYQCDKLSEVTLPEGVCSIGWMAFASCDKLTTVNLPSSLKEIGNAAFSGDARLTTVTGGSGVTSIGDAAFYRCGALTGFVFGQSLQEIGQDVFFGCRSLTGVVIPDSVSIIWDNAFMDCTLLTDIILPEKFLSIHEGAFYNTGAYNSADNWNDGVLYIGRHLIEANTQTVTASYAVLPDTLTVADSAFSWCDRLTHIYFPNGLCRIGQEAFRSCSNLTEVTIPDSMTEIGYVAFYDCVGLERVTIGNGEIGERAFEGCTGLIEATVQGGSIGYQAFMRCTALSTLTVGTGAVSIASEAFHDCESLTTVSIDGGRIARAAFLGCTGIKTITLGNAVTDIGDAAFGSMPDLRSAVVRNGAIYDGMFYGCTKLSSMTIGTGVTAIGESAFFDCTGLRNLTIPNSVKTIETSAFSGCTGLRSIRIPSDVKVIGDYTFYNCTGLQTVSIPSGVTIIGRQAFSDCTGLTEILIPETVQSIGFEAFYRCTELMHATVCSGAIGWEAFSSCHNLNTLTLKKGVTSIGQEAFYGCIRLTKLEIPGSVTTIGWGAFSYCTGLTEVTIGVGVSAIGSDAFYGCSQITGVVIPDSVSTIGSYAFSHRMEEPDTCFYCSPGSYAQTYAKEYGFPVSVTFGGNLSRLPNGIRFISYSTGSTVADVSYDLSDGGLTATKSGYYTINIENCTLSAKAKTQLALVPDTTDSDISAVHAEGRDVLAKGFLAPKTGTLQLQVYPASGVQVTRYQFLHNNTVIAENNDGSFNLPANKLQQVSGYAVRVFDQNGKAKQKLYFGVISKKDPPDVSLDFPAIKVKVPEDVPVIGGSDFSVDLKDLPFSMFVSEDTIKIGIGTKRHDEDESDESEIKEVKSFLENIRKHPELFKKNHVPYARKAKDKGVDWFACGYLDIRKGETGWELVSGDFAIGAVGTVEYSAQFILAVAPLAIPFVISVKGEASGKAILKLTSDPDWAIGLNGIVELVVPSATVSAGPGIKKLANVSVYGSFNNTVTVDFGNENVTGKLTGEAGVSAYCLGLTFQKAIFEWEKEWQYYPSEEKKGASSLDRALAEASDPDQYTLKRQKKSVSSAFRTTDNMTQAAFMGWEQERQTDIYNGTSPQMVRLANGKQILIWLDDIEERTDLNQTALLYSVFDPDEYCWTEPRIVADNGTADYTPKIATDGQVTYVVWCDANTVFSGEESLTEMASHVEICVARFDDENNCFEEPEQLTNDNYYDTMPAVLVSDGKYRVAWVQSTSNDPFLMQGNKNVYVKISNQKAWQVVRYHTRPITELQLGWLGNQIMIAFISNGDSKYLTTDKMELWLGKITGQAQYVWSSEGALSNLSFTSLDGQRVLTFWKDGDLVSIDTVTTGSGTEVITQMEGVLSSDFTAVAGEDHTLFLFQTADRTDGSNLYAYRYQDGTWSKSVRVTSGDGYIRSVSGFYDGYGDLQLAYVREIPTILDDSLEISTTLYTGTYYPGDANLALVSVDYDEAGIGAGEALPVTLTVQNNGFAPVEGLRIAVEDEDWTTVFEQLTDTVVGIGETVSVTVNFPFPELEGIATYTITAEPASGYDTDWSDNDAEFTIGYTDLSLTLEQSSNGMAKSVVLTVGNAGGKTEEAYLVIYEGSRDGRRLQSYSLGDIESGQTEQFAFEAEWLQQLDADTLYFEVACETPDRAEYNNGDYLFRQRTIVPLGNYYDVNGDGEVNSEDLTVLRYYLAGGWDVEIDEANADINGDGEITSKDVTLLRRYLAGGWGVE